MRYRGSRRSLPEIARELNVQAVVEGSVLHAGDRVRWDMRGFHTVMLPAAGGRPAELLAQAPTFAKGQALFAGGFTGEPQLVQVGERLTEEGGSDVRIPLR